MPAGWYQDPSAPSQLRWWDGSQWTEHVVVSSAGGSPAGVSPARRSQPIRPAVLWSAVAGFVVLVLAASVALVVVGGTRTPSRASGTLGAPTNSQPAPTTPQTLIAGPDPGEGGVARLAAAAGIPVLDQEGSVTHTHTLVKIHAAGAALPVWAYIGIDRRTGRLAAVHTHDSSGIVHVESPKVDDHYTIGQFLTLAGEGSTEAELCSYFIHGPCSVRVDVVAPTAEDHQRFARYGPMPDKPPVPAEGLNTLLGQGAVLDVHIDPAS